MNKIKVLMVGNHESVKGGITSVISQLMRHEWENDNISIKFIPTYVEKNNIIKMMYFIFAYIKIWSYILFCKPDLVHIHMSYRGSFHRKYVIHRICRRHKVQDIIHLHGSEFEKWYNESNEKARGKIRKLLRESGAFVVLGDKWNKVIKGIEPLTNTVVVGNAVDIPNEKVEWNNDYVNVLFLGVLIKRKGVDELIDAVSELKKSKKIGKMHFIIAGTGKEETTLKEKCRNLDLNQNVSFVGWIDGKKKMDLIRECQIMVLPSYNEGLPISILEAIAYGMPIIATDVGDMASAVKNDKNGYLIKPGNVTDISDALVKISEDKARYTEMSHMSRKIAEEHFSSKVFYRSITECYKSLLDK